MCIREESETSVERCTSIALFQSHLPASCCLQYGPTRTASNRKLPENEASISMSWIKAAVLLPRKLQQMNNEQKMLQTTSLTGDGAIVISDSLVASWMSESEITITAIMRSGTCQRKEGRRSEPPSSTVCNCSTVSLHIYACRWDQVTTSSALPVRSGPVQSSPVQSGF